MLTITVQHPPSLVLPVLAGVTIGAGNLVALDTNNNAILAPAGGAGQFGVATDDQDSDDTSRPARVEIHVKPAGYFLGLAMRLKISGAVNQGAAVFAAANGQASATGTGTPVGYAMETGADQELVICAV